MAKVSSSRRSEANGLDAPQNAPSLKNKRTNAKERRATVGRTDKSSNGGITQEPRRSRSNRRPALFPGENHATYAALHGELKKLYRPETPLHVEAVARATDLIWRLRRIPAFEAALFNSTSRSLGRPAASSTEKYFPEGESTNFGYVLRAMLKTGALRKLAQYEATLRDQLTLAYSELEEILDEHLR